MLIVEMIMLKVIEKRIGYDKDFYNNEGFKSTPAAWSRFKNGEVSILDMKYGKVRNMLSYLFTPLELQIIDKIQFEKNSNWLKKEPLERYREIKVELLKEWLELPTTVVSLQRYSLPNGRQSVNYLAIKKDEYNSISFSYKMPTGFGVSSKIPAGKQNRKEWILKNMDLLEF